MEHILKIKINDQYKAGKKFLAYLRTIVKSSKAVALVQEEELETDEDNNLSFAALSESSLAKEWLSPEDDVWDEWLKEKEA